MEMQFCFYNATLSLVFSSSYLCFLSHCQGLAHELVRGGYTTGWTAAAKVQRQTHRLRNQAAESQGRPYGQRPGVGVNAGGAGNALGIGDRLWRDLESELGAPTEPWSGPEELARFHLLLQSYFTWPPQSGSPPCHLHGSSPPIFVSLVLVLSTRSTSFLCPTPPFPAWPTCMHPPNGACSAFPHRSK